MWGALYSPVCTVLWADGSCAPSARYSIIHRFQRLTRIPNQLFILITLSSELKKSVLSRKNCCPSDLLSLDLRINNLRLKVCSWVFWIKFRFLTCRSIAWWSNWSVNKKYFRLKVCSRESRVKTWFFSTAWWLSWLIRKNNFGLKVCCWVLAVSNSSKRCGDNTRDEQS